MAVTALDELGREYYDFWHALFPVEATWLGIHEHDARLGDLGAEGLQHAGERLRAFRQRLARIGDEGLSVAERVDRRLLAAAMRDLEIWLVDHAEWRRNPNLYAETPVMGIFLLATREFAPLEERLRSMLGRLRETPDVLAAARANVRRPPRVYVEVALETCAGASQFLRGLVPQLAARVPELEAAVRAEAERAAAAYDSYADELRARLPSADGEFALGRALFDELLHVRHGLDLDAPALGALGRRLFAETLAQLEAEAAAIAPGRGWRELIAEARREHPAGNDLLPAYRRELASLVAFIRERDLVTIPPGERLEVIETPLFLRATLPYAAYMMPAPFEQDRTGRFLVTPVDASAPPEQQEAQLQEHAWPHLKLTALHEAYPGHHLQLVVASDVGGVIRKHAHSSLLAEGWALYCEQLMADQGYFTDPRARLFQLKDYLWRCARVFIDVGLHTEGMAVEEAERILVEEVGLAPASARAEVRRYTASPTQPMTYATGKWLLLQLRERYGAGRPLRQFHDALLASGTIPVPLVELELQERL